MCFYYAVVKTSAKELVKNGIIKEEQLSLFSDQQFVKGFDFPLMPVISSDKPEDIQMFRWGFVPPHIRSDKKAKEFLNRYNTLNARSETIFESRLFNEVIHKQRCLVLCSGFFEWRHKNPGKKNSEKYPFYVSLKDDGMFVFGGLWEKFTDQSTGEIIHTYAIVTTPANELMEIVHNNKKRMPLIIEPEKALNWLGTDLSENEIKSYFKPFDSSKLKATPIKKINPRLQYKNDPGITVYYHYEELGSLLNNYPEYFEQSVDFRKGNSPTLF
ncbi:MAG: SOS response-associated peptidase [Prolixibacteraceae bacterium]|jgi:putative SOS response-associated peptidase YedK|nr:SOS response-associated peptidase [Prolixibacteraceae bacterium]MBT6764295.1 SOS response-associated peptidase [Prolixibacteraceae bacterium]MBT7000932.1 SOS response-associated peptidase [Prolixibacteraceae bacterium]MBT7397323.1 SOS response-associated peptidase [Prolixibacteraceae bacterium]